MLIQDRRTLIRDGLRPAPHHAQDPPRPRRVRLRDQPPLKKLLRGNRWSAAKLRGFRGHPAQCSCERFVGGGD